MRPSETAAVTGTPEEFAVLVSPSGGAELYLVLAGDHAIGHYATREVAQGIVDLLEARDAAVRRAALAEFEDLFAHGDFTLTSAYGGAYDYDQKWAIEVMPRWDDTIKVDAPTFLEAVEKVLVRARPIRDSARYRGRVSAEPPK